MRFLAHDLRSGTLRLTEAPTPVVPRNGVLVRTVASLISAGTERMLIDFGRANLLDKARQQPDRVRQVLDKARTEGVAETVDAVRSKLARPQPLGYASAGLVVEVGADVRDLRVGQLVATNGPHAELVVVPRTFVAPAPDGLPAEHACFATIAAVGLQGLRLADPTIGEHFAVTGLGLVGLLTVQLLRANGCQVLGIDPSPERRQLAVAMGAEIATPESAEEVADRSTGGRGLDGVLVCASTASSDPLRAAARMCRQRGRMVLVGVTGLELDRAELYEKELTLQVSASFGPGRYDPAHQSGTDYPFGLVRWTAGRNMEAVLALLASGRLDVAPLITHRRPFDEAPLAYDALVEDPDALGILLEYADEVEVASVAPRPTARRARSISTTGGIAVIGAGNFAMRTLLPAIAEAGGRTDVVVASNAISAALAAEKVGARPSSDVDAVLGDPSIGSVFIATRHDSHVTLATKALEAGKAVYVEKPLALTHDALDRMIATVESLDAACRLPVLTVGFNRRWAPTTVRMRQLLETTSSPKAVLITVNAGAVPRTHWVHDPTVGGGRLLGEGCHFIDLARHLVAAPITEVRTAWLADLPDTAIVTISFEDGSVADVQYLANGSPRVVKERVVVFSGGRTLVNENFRKLGAHGWPGRRGVRSRRAEKGHVQGIAAFLAAARTGADAPIPFDELVEVSRAAIDAATR